MLYVHVLGKCKALWGKSRTWGHLNAFCEMLSHWSFFFFFFWSIELVCMMFDEERSRKAKATDEQCYGTVFCVNTAADTRAQPSYELRSYVFVRNACSRKYQDSFSCWTGLALANEKEDECWRKEWTWKVKTTAQSTTEFFVFQQSFYWTRRFDPETRAFFGYTSKLSKQIHLYIFVALSRCCYASPEIVLKKC